VRKNLEIVSVFPSAAARASHASISVSGISCSTIFSDPSASARAAARNRMSPAGVLRFRCLSLGRRASCNHGHAISCVAGFFEELAFRRGWRRGSSRRSRSSPANPAGSSITLQRDGFRYCSTSQKFVVISHRKRFRPRRSPPTRSTYSQTVRRFDEPEKSLRCPEFSRDCSIGSLP